VACASTPTSATNSTGSTATSHPANSGQSATIAARKIPRPDHVVVVVFENKEEGSVIGSPDAPYINSLADGGALMTQSYGVTHPSQPNYLALFSGSTQGVVDDSCPHTFKSNNQAHEMLKAGYTFVSYSEGLPSPGSLACTSGKYARKHAPWTNFPNVPADDQQPFTSFPSEYSQLPDVSWVIPDLCDDMHDCSIATGDTWMQNNLGGYASWAMTHNSLLILTFDEDDSKGTNQIATIFYGQPVKQGTYDEHITHYTVLRTMEAMYGVPALANAKKLKPIKDIWRR
jgi:phospholipase C